MSIVDVFKDYIRSIITDGCGGTPSSRNSCLIPHRPMLAERPNQMGPRGAFPAVRVDDLAMRMIMSVEDRLYYTQRKRLILESSRPLGIVTASFLAGRR